MRILVSSDYYLPAYKAGGALRTLANLVETLGDEFEFRIITRDRDLDGEAYDGIRPGGWQRVGRAEVLYLPPERQGLRDFRRLLRATRHDVLYLNSFFSPAFTLQPLLLRRAGLVPRRPVVLAPQGEFSVGALQLKAYKKRPFLALARLAGLYEGVHWLASSRFEASDIQRELGGACRVHVAAAAIATPTPDRPEPGVRSKRAGTLRVVFLSRIAEKKNLWGALRLLEGLEGDIEFTIYGPIEEPAYWSRCEEAMRALPANVRVRYGGVVHHDDVHRVLREQDLFLFPTFGENFGHVVLEALLAGCPVLLSDRTPWRHLEQDSGGWVVPLDDADRFRAVLQRCVGMDERERERRAEAAWQIGKRFVEDRASADQNRAVFRAAREN